MDRVLIILRCLTSLFGALITVTVNACEDTSSWANRVSARKPWPKRWINRLFFWQDDHCAGSVEAKMFACIEFAAAHGLDLVLVEKTSSPSVPVLAPKKDEPKVQKILKAASTPAWAWTEADFNQWITRAGTDKPERDFYNGIKRDGFLPKGVSMTNEEWKHWANRAIKYATAWVAQHDTPAPAPHHGMSE